MAFMSAFYNQYFQELLGAENENFVNDMALVFNGKVHKIKLVYTVWLLCCFTCSLFRVLLGAGQRVHHWSCLQSPEW